MRRHGRAVSETIPMNGGGGWQVLHVALPHGLLLAHSLSALVHACVYEMFHKYRIWIRFLSFVSSFSLIV